MKTIVLFLLSLNICCNLAFAAERGIKRVEIKTVSGETVGLYEESHALVIGVSNYTGGWPKLPGVRDDIVSVMKRHWELLKNFSEIFIGFSKTLIG